MQLTFQATEAAHPQSDCGWDGAGQGGAVWGGAERGRS